MRPLLDRYVKLGDGIRLISPRSIELSDHGRIVSTELGLELGHSTNGSRDFHEAALCLDHPSEVPQLGTAQLTS